jgi:hypothetical protein
MCLLIVSHQMHYFYKNCNILVAFPKPFLLYHSASEHTVGDPFCISIKLKYFPKRFCYSYFLYVIAFVVWASWSLITRKLWNDQWNNFRDPIRKTRRTNSKYKQSQIQDICYIFFRWNNTDRLKIKFSTYTGQKLTRERCADIEHAFSNKLTLITLPRQRNLLLFRRRVIQCRRDASHS